MICQNRAGIVIRLAGMDHHRERQLGSKRQLLIKCCFLCVSVSVVVVVIETDFANGHDAPICGAGLDPLSQRGGPAFGFVGVNALRTPNGWVSVGQVAYLIQIVCRDGNRHDPLNADSKGIIQRLGQCLRVQIIQVAVRLNNRRVELRDFSAAVLSH